MSFAILDKNHRQEPNLKSVDRHIQEASHHYWVNLIYTKQRIAVISSKRIMELQKRKRKTPSAV